MDNNKRGRKQGREVGMAGVIRRAGEKAENYLNNN